MKFEDVPGEAKAVKACLERLLTFRHEHVASLLDVVEDAVRLYLIYEWPEGGFLFQHLACHGDINEAEIRSILHQLVFAMEDAVGENFLVDRFDIEPYFDFSSK